MSSNPSGANHPTFFMLVWAAASVGLQSLLPLRLPEMSLTAPIAKILTASGMLLFVWAQVVFWRHGATPDHWRPTTALVTSGPFRFSRNPIYVAFILLFSGIALNYGNGWGLLLVPPFALALHFRTILREEVYLEREFGTAYVAYREAVRRWL